MWQVEISTVEITLSDGNTPACVQPTVNLLIPNPQCGPQALEVSLPARSTPGAR